MKVLICADKFKGSLSAQEVAEAIARGIRRFDQAVECQIHPLADGGDGSLNILSTYLDLQKISLMVADPFGNPVEAVYYRSGGKAFVELAAASGLVLLPPGQRNPMLTSTQGTGELIKDAIEKGANEIVLFLGGSATNDGGAGIAQALGFRFLDASGKEVVPIGKNLIHIRQIVPPAGFVKKSLRFSCLCDVKNPLLGETGAAHTYAAQKGASEKEIEQLELGMKQYAQVINRQFSMDISAVPGGGAAGGVAAGLQALLGAEIRSGIDLFLELSQFEARVKSADLVITGEGKLDIQTLEGKVVNGVLQIARQYQKPVLLLVGTSELEKETLAGKGVVEVLTVMSRSAGYEDAMARAAEIIEGLAYEYFNARGG